MYLLGDDRRIRVWDLNTGSLFKELRGHTETVHSLSFNKDSTLLASGWYKLSYILQFRQFYMPFY